jgi:hypothetical protein
MISVELRKIYCVKLRGKVNNSEWVKILKKTAVNDVIHAAKQSKVLRISLTQYFVS